MLSSRGQGQLLLSKDDHPTATQGCLVEGSEDQTYERGLQECKAGGPLPRERSHFLKTYTFPRVPATTKEETSWCSFKFPFVISILVPGSNAKLPPSLTLAWCLTEHL